MCEHPCSPSPSVVLRCCVPSRSAPKEGVRNACRSVQVDHGVVTRCTLSHTLGCCAGNTRGGIPGRQHQGGNTRAATSANFVCLLVFFLVFFCCVAATLLDASLPAVAVGSPGVGPDEGGGIGVPTQVPLCHSMCKPNFNAWPNCTDGRLALADAAGGGPCGETGAGRGDWWPAGEPRRPTAA